MNNEGSGVWNRSSAWSPKVLAIFTESINAAVQKALHAFESEFDMLNLTKEQRDEAILLLCNGVTDTFQNFEKSLRPRHVEIEQSLKS
jgi:hypothetical protein